MEYLKSTPTEEDTHTYIHTSTHAQTHMHTLVLEPVISQPCLGHLDPINGVSQLVAIKLVAPLAAETPSLSLQSHSPLSAVGVVVLIKGVGYGLE